jgi:3-carboxy-cis,cis-muconate cycloisomerase
VQLGGAAGTLAAYIEYARAAGVPIEGHAAALTEGVAAELGLPAPAAPWHTQRTPVADLGWLSVVITGALGKIAVDVLGASRTEVGEVAEPAGERSGLSSAMPQKRNPVLATLLVSAARQTPAYAAMLGQSMLAEDERSPGGWQSEWQPLRETLRLAGGAAHTAAELVEGLRVFPDRLKANLDMGGGTIVAERLNVVLAPILGKAAAKSLLGRIAAQAAAGEGTFADLLRGAPELKDQFGGALDDLLDPANYLGAADELVDRVLARRAALTTMS